MNKRQSGQTIIVLLIFMLMAITLTVSATAVIIINLQGNTAYQSGEVALQNAQTGIENALIRLERDPAYTGETMTLGSGTATITVSGTAPYTIISVGKNGQYTRTITATATITNHTLTVISWSETP